jgi:uncharacterized protein (DUF1684 family)
MIPTAFLLSGCDTPQGFPPLSPADSTTIVRNNLTHRANADSSFRSGEGSPFLRDTTIRFTGLRWFPVNVRYRGESILHRINRPDTVTIQGTRGEERRHLRYGWFEFPVPDSNGRPRTIRLNVYKFTPSDERRYRLYRDHLNVWFTDATTGAETYDVGRYVDVGEEHPDPDHRYSIDLNKAYNPYCAYSLLYSCAVPRKEDHVPFPVRAGELKYHP